MQKSYRKFFALLQRNLMIKSCFYALLLVFLWSCLDPLPPMPESEVNAVEKSRDELSEYIIAAPDYDPVREDSMVNDLLRVMLNQPPKRELENLYALRSYWMNKYGKEENMQLYAELAYTKLLDQGDVMKACQVRLIQGRSFYLEGQLGPAVKNTQEAFGLAVEIEDSTTMAWAMNHLAAAAGQAGKLEVSTEYSDRGMAITKAIGDRTIETYLLVNIGILWHRKGEIDSSLHYFEKGLAMAKEEGLDEIEALTTSNTSYALLTSGKQKRAISLLKEALEGKDEEVSLPISMLTLTMAEAYMALKMPDEAYPYMVRGCEMSDELSVAVGIDACKQLWYQYYEQKGNVEEALVRYKDYHAYSLEQSKEASERHVAVLDAESKIKKRDARIRELETAKRTKEQAYRSKRLRWFFIGGCLFAIAGAVFWHLQFRAKLKLTNQQRIAAEAKLNVLQSQMNPHFIYNALSGIQNFILHSKKIEAFNYLSKFAGLLRIITKSSTEIFIELEREVELLNTYLDLEKLRFRDAFSYVLVVDNDLQNENLRIPSMMIQPVVENAIIHGLSKLKDGQLSLKIQREGDGILCIVTDNGRGREAAIEIAKKNKLNHLSIATVNGNERIQSLQSLGYTHAKIEIDDLYDGDQPKGTRVRIYLPFK